MQEANAKHRRQHSGWHAGDSLELIRSKMSRKAKLVVQPEPGLLVEGDRESQGTDLTSTEQASRAAKDSDGAAGRHLDAAKVTRQGFVLCGVSPGMSEKNCSIM